LLQGEAEEKGAERLTDGVGGPGADPQRVGHSGNIGSSDKLAPQRSQSLARLADQECVDEIAHMPSLRLRERQVELVEKHA
jgi:hypothetical protein